MGRTILQHIGELIGLSIGIWVALPALVDFAAWIVGKYKRQLAPGPQDQLQHLLFLVPAHDEALLVRRCIQSLLSQDYPGELLEVVVIADNCQDDTASLGRAAGATVLERSDPQTPGKGHAIAWALERLGGRDAAAVVIVDADSIVEPDFSRELMRWAPLENRALQVYDGASNEFETWLTRLAGLLTRSRYSIALPLKRAAGLSCPLTGDGVVLGSELLARYPWHAVTITEGWEFYARLTTEGVRIEFAGSSILYAQEATTMGQSRTQRERWTSGRLAVLRLYLGRLVGSRRISLLQRLDLLAELTNLGPVVRSGLGLVGVTLGAWMGGATGWGMALLASTGILQPIFYSLISLRHHPERRQTVAALAYFPVYFFWRAWVGIRAFTRIGTTAWVRTRRREEGTENTPDEDLAAIANLHRSTGQEGTKKG